MFDLGGVLVNYNGKELADRLYEASKGDYEMIRKLLSFEYLYPIETGRMSTKEYYEKYVTKAMPGLSFDTLTDIYAEHFTPNAPGIELLRMIKRKGRKVYLLSNLADFHKTAAERRIPDVFALFDKQFLSYEMGCHKPEPEIYAKACAHIGNEPDKIVFFDDMEINVAGAVKEGIRGIRFSNDRLDSIKEIIRKLENDPDFV